MIRSTLRAISIALLVVLSPVVSPAQCTGTIISAPPSPGTTWTAAFSPYCITGNISIPQLTIQAGCQISVYPGVTISVPGSLIVAGAPGNPVRFSEFQPGMGWNGLNFTGSGSSLSGCILEDARNSAVRVNDTDLQMSNCVLRSNRSSGSGGGVWISQPTFLGSVSLTNCEIVNNLAFDGHGGGIYASIGGSDLSIHGCSLSSNTADRGTTPFPFSTNRQRLGGGAYIAATASGTVTVSHTTINNNLSRSGCRGGAIPPGSCSVTGRGGGIAFAGGTVSVTTSEIRNNTARAEGSANPGSVVTLGGGVHVSGGNVTIGSTVIAGNTLANSGGNSHTRAGAGIYVGGGTVDVINCTIANNVYEGISIAAGTNTLTNSILWGNTPSAPTGASSQVVTSGGSLTASFNCVQGPVPASWFASINTDPQFKVPTGTTSTQLETFSSSPCVDAGDPAISDATFPELPGRGLSRSDMGQHGGDNAGWYPWTTPGFSLLAPPNPAPLSPFAFSLTVPPVPTGTIIVIGISCTGTTMGGRLPDGRQIPLVFDSCTNVVLQLSAAGLGQFLALAGVSGTASTTPFPWPFIAPGQTFYCSAVAIAPSGEVVAISSPILVTS